jgi:hypothetical protein
MPKDNYALSQYLKIQNKTDRQVMALLRLAKRDVDAHIKSLVGDSPSLVVRREQLLMSRKALDEALARIWVNLREIIETQALVAGEGAAKVGGAFDRTILRQALSAPQMAALEQSNILQARQAVQHALNRSFDASGSTNRTLSEKVYHSRKVIDGQLDRLINSALARGLSAKEFAREAIRFIRPDAAGGVRYAAMRLARTEINNAFHYAQRLDTARKPWVTGQRWFLSGSHPRPDECNSFAAHNEGMGIGIWPKDGVPNKPHPNCLCYIAPETVSEEEWLRKFQKGEYNDYLDSRMPTGLPRKTDSSIFATPAQVKAFTRNSKFKEPFKHVSNERNAPSIAKSGLKSGEGQAAGAKYGKGVYVATDDMTTAAYERAAGIDGLEKGKTITYDVYVRVKKPFDIDVGNAKIKSLLSEDRGLLKVVAKLTGDQEMIDNLYKKYLKQFQEWQKMALSDKFFDKPEELLERATQSRFGVSTKDIQSPHERAIRAYLVDNGYDSLHIFGLKKFSAKIGGNQLLIFDDNNVMIVNPTARRGK